MATKYLRQFPGKKRFQSVSKDDWETPMPSKDIAGWGHILTLQADVRVWAPDGELVLARKWPSKSYIRNFARIMRSIFGSNIQLIDRTGTAQSTFMNNAGGFGGPGLIPGIFQETVNTAQNGNCELSGAAMAIGQGVASETHTRNDMVSRVGGIYSARQNVRTTVLNTSTTTIEITTGITNGQATSINITEIALFAFVLNTSTNSTVAVPFSTLLAYDGITSTPVASGGVIAPRYTMDFPV